MPRLQGGRVIEDALEYDNAGAPVNGTDEVQTLTIGGTPTGGTFKLAFDGYTTQAIPWFGNNDANLASVTGIILSALASIGASGVTGAVGTLTNGIGTITLTFGGNLTKKAVPNITVAANNLTGTAPTLAIAETTPGVDATCRGAAKGATLQDTTNGILYINTGTALAPVWTKVGTQT